jgi:hypothetical protein
MPFLPLFEIENECRRCQGSGVEPYQFEDGVFPCGSCNGTRYETLEEEYDNLGAAAEDYKHARSIKTVGKRWIAPRTVADGFEIGQKIQEESASLDILKTRVADEIAKAPEKRSPGFSLAGETARINRLEARQKILAESTS